MRPPKYSIHPRRGRRQHQSLLRQIEDESSTIERICISVRIGLSPQSPDVHRSIPLRLLDHLLRGSLLFIDVSLDHLSREAGSQSSVLATLEQNADHNVRIPARREADEPAVLRQVVTI